MGLRICGSFAKHSSRLVFAGVAVVAVAGMARAAAASTLCVNTEGKHGCMATIGAAVAAASPGDVIQVWPGTYPEMVTITKALSLLSSVPHGAVIDATNLSNGIWVNGMSAAPAAGISNVVIAGFKVRHANFEGILLTNASDVTLRDNQVMDNDVSLAGDTCPGIPDFETNEGQDCGEGVHLMAVDHSTIVRNEVSGNGGGILISDETGPTSHNQIRENYVHDNVYDCGITMASHGPATSVLPTAKGPYGVWYNTISHNVSRRNGTVTPGAGVGIFAPFPGTTAAGNVVIYNDIRDNGATGVAMHNHAYAPSPAPGVNFNDNVIVGNYFSGNGPDNPGAPTSGPTAINIFSMAPMTGTVIAENTFAHEAIDIGYNVAGGQLNVHLNDFSNGVGIENLGGAGTVDATENWWNCATGPGGKRCAAAQGPGIMVTPWLTMPYSGDEDDHHGRD